MTRLGRDTRLARIIHLVEDGAGAAARRCSRSSIALRASTRRRSSCWPLGSRWCRRSARRPMPATWLYRVARAARHRLPVRAGDLDAGVDRGGAVGRGAQRRADQGRRLPRAARGRPRRRVRQDRDADDGRAAGDRRRRRSAPRPPRDVLRFAAAVESRSEHPIAQGDRRTARRHDGLDVARVDRVHVDARAWARRRTSAGQRVVVGNDAHDVRASASAMPPIPARGCRRRRRALGRVRRRRRDARSARSRWPIGRARRRARRSSCCASTGFVTSRC